MLTGLLAAAANQSGMLGRTVDDSPAMIALFQRPDCELVYLNSTGRRWFRPNADPEASITLRQLIGPYSSELFENEIQLQTKIFGRWSGELTLVDAWESELVVHATLTDFPGEMPDAPKLLCLQAVKLIPGEDYNKSNAGAGDQELLHALLETLPDSIYFKDVHSRFVRVSRAMAEKLSGGDPAAMIGRTDFDYFTSEHALPAYEAEYEIMRSGQPLIDLEEKETWPNGDVTWVTTTKMPLRDRDGRIVGTYGISRDITARRENDKQKVELMAQLALAQRLESIGRLAAGVAHEINTPLQFVTDNAHFLQTSFQQVKAVITAYRDLVAEVEMTGMCQEALAHVRAAEQENELDYLIGEVPRTFDQTLDGLGRISRIVSSLKEFSHPNNAKLAKADLNRVIENAIVVSRHEWKYVAEVKTDFDPKLPLAPCIVDEFNQVLLNLLVNAAHAIESARKGSPGTPGLGLITITTRHDEDSVMIDVRDTGTGIPPEIRDLIFEPFFTTKEAGKGTGQGLSLVRNIVVNHHQGSVSLTSEVGQGTTFHVKIPRHVPLEPK